MQDTLFFVVQFSIARAVAGWLADRCLIVNSHIELFPHEPGFQQQNMQRPDYSKMNEHGTSPWPPVPCRRATNTRSIYASLKTQIDEIIEIFTESQQHDAAELIPQKRKLPQGVKTQKHLTRIVDRLGTPATVSEQQNLLPSLNQVKKYYRKSLITSERFDQGIGDSWTRRANQWSEQSSDSVESIVSHHDHEVDNRMTRELRGHTSDSASQETYPPLTIPFHPLLSRWPTSILSQDRSNSNSLELWHEGQSQLKLLPSTEPDMKSYFDTSSETNVEASHHIIFKSRILKLKETTFKWLRETFSLDEEEKAFFAGRRSMRSEELFAKQRNPLFINGRRVR